MAEPALPAHALREVPYMGVIFVVAEAHKLGFYNGHPDWSNLGQGQPEVGPMQGAPDRFATLTLRPEDHAYGPLEGINELREAVAAHYNRLYRQGKKPYTKDHVAIAQGGRLALSRAMVALGPVHVGYQLPDYTAYEDMLNLHLARLSAVPVRTRPEDGFQLSAETFARARENLGLSAFVFSNPCNPTGNVVQGQELAAIVDECRRHDVTLLSDEFYSHFIYEPKGQGDAKPGKGPVSSASFVDDPDRDPVLVFDGLTKSFRYPGWRLGWVLGPKPMVEAIARTASALDGGSSRWSQRAAIEVLKPAAADQETAALRQVFCEKRNEMVRRLLKMGVRLPAPSASTFYCWGSLEDLPPPLNDAMTFFRRALELKVMTVPGQFFDVNPGKYRRGRSPYSDWMRFSFGPPMANMQMGLSRLEEMLAAAR
jgi:aspartate/methionine/tyrosine aminotransferase